MPVLASAVDPLVVDPSPESEVEQAQQNSQDDPTENEREAGFSDERERESEEVGSSNMRVCASHVEGMDF